MGDPGDRDPGFDVPEGLRGQRSPCLHVRLRLRPYASRQPGGRRGRVQLRRRRDLHLRLLPLRRGDSSGHPPAELPGSRSVPRRSAVRSEKGERDDTMRYADPVCARSERPVYFFGNAPFALGDIDYGFYNLVDRTQDNETRLELTEPICSTCFGASSPTPAETDHWTVYHRYRVDDALRPTLTAVCTVGGEDERQRYGNDLEQASIEFAGLWAQAWFHYTQGGLRQPAAARSRRARRGRRRRSRLAEGDGPRLSGEGKAAAVARTATTRRSPPCGTRSSCVPVPTIRRSTSSARWNADGLIGELGCRLAS